MHRPHAAQIRTLARTVKSGDPANIEGQGARVYWSSYLPERGFRRDQVSDDVVNGMLNYGYTILRGRVLTRVISAGLSPTLSLFHRNRSNAFVLAEKVSDNQDFTVRSVIENFCSEFALYVEGKRDTLKVPIWKLSMSEPDALKEGE